MRHLFVTQDYGPELGGMARRYVELCRRLAVGGDTLLVSTVAAGGAAAFDAREPYPIERQPFGFRAASRFGAQLRWARWLVRRCRAGVDVLHTGNIRSAGYAAWWAHRRTGLPYFVYVNGGDLLRERRKLAASRIKRAGTRALLGDATAVIAISTWSAQLARDVMAEAGVRNPPPVAQTDLGTDPAWFRPDRDARALRRRFGLGDAPLLVTVARLVPHKGQDVAIEALARLAPEMPALRYLLVGGGHDEARLRALAARLGVADRVVFAGNLSDDDVAEAYATASVYVGLSRLDRGLDVEGFGISFIEAGASGVPCVAGDSGGVRSAVRDGETGLVVPPQDVDAVTAALRRLLRDEPLRARMGRRARELALTHYNWDRVAAATRDVVREALAARPSR